MKKQSPGLTRDSATGKTGPFYLKAAVRVSGALSAAFFIHRIIASLYLSKMHVHAELAGIIMVLTFRKLMKKAENRRFCEEMT